MWITNFPLWTFETGIKMSKNKLQNNKFGLKQFYKKKKKKTNKFSLHVHRPQ
jgi:hypothetical protein